MSTNHYKSLWLKWSVYILHTVILLNISRCQGTTSGELEASCIQNSDCSHMRFAHCHNGACSCYPYHIKYNSTSCLPASLLGYGCLLSKQCQMKVPHSHCVNGICMCQRGYTRLRRDRCLNGAKVGQFCASDKQCHLHSPDSFCNFIIPRVYGRCACAFGFTTDSNKRCVPLTSEIQVSLGKYCENSRQCQSRDPYSHCLNHTCQCVVPSPSCNAQNIGCHKDTFQCRNGQCVSWYFVCNGQKNCADGSDEEDCIRGRCPPEAFQCQNGDCISRAKLCNGKRDCLDGSDELNCFGNCNSTLTFGCKDGTCLPKYMFCNAVSSCKDNSDEDYVICDLGSHCSFDHFRCTNGRCRSTAILCSGKDGCGDNSDESHCEVCYCSKPL